MVYVQFTSVNDDDILCVIGVILFKNDSFSAVVSTRNGLDQLYRNRFQNVYEKLYLYLPMKSVLSRMSFFLDV